MLRILFELASQVLMRKRLDDAGAMVFYSSLVCVSLCLSLARAAESGGAGFAFLRDTLDDL